jgi:hypothetical protein
MEDVKLTDYEATEAEGSNYLTQNAETSNGTVKHNGLIGLLAYRLPESNRQLQKTAVRGQSIS